MLPTCFLGDVLRAPSLLGDGVRGVPRAVPATGLPVDKGTRGATRFGEFMLAEAGTLLGDPGARLLVVVGLLGEVGLLLGDCLPEAGPDSEAEAGLRPPDGGGALVCAGR